MRESPGGSLETWDLSGLQPGNLGLVGLPGKGLVSRGTHLGFTRGKAGKQVRATRPEFRVISSYTPGISPGFCLVSGGNSAFSQVFSLGKHLGFSRLGGSLPTRTQAET